MTDYEIIIAAAEKLANVARSLERQLSPYVEEHAMLIKHGISEDCLDGFICETWTKPQTKGIDYLSNIRLAIWNLHMILNTATKPLSDEQKRMKSLEDRIASDTEELTKLKENQND